MGSFLRCHHQDFTITVSGSVMSGSAGGCCDGSQLAEEV